MAEAYVGSIVLEVDGQEIEVTKVEPKTNTGRKLVKTMNSSGKAKGHAQGIPEYTLSVSAVAPLDDDGELVDIDWDSLEDAKLTIYPINRNNKRTSYLGCFTTEVGESYTVDNEAMQDIQMSALRKVRE